MVQERPYNLDNEILFQLQNMDTATPSYTREGKKMIYHLQTCFFEKRPIVYTMQCADAFLQTLLNATIYKNGPD